jgi:hypothetical protein
MADFLLLPPRPAIGEEIARLIRPYLPGVRVTAADCLRFLDGLAATSGGKAFLIHREELPDEEDVSAALRDGFGAEPGDRVIHIMTGRPADPRLRIEAIEDALVVG